jgi:F-type H+-transporting ATPase subunit alpha
VVEVLKQPQFDPVPVEQQVVVIYAVTTGAMDDIDLSKIAEAESAMREYFMSRANHVLEEIASTGKIPAGDALDVAIAAFKETLGN